MSSAGPWQADISVSARLGENGTLSVNYQILLLLLSAVSYKSFLSILGPCPPFPALREFLTWSECPGIHPSCICQNSRLSSKITSPANSPDLSSVSMETDQMRWQKSHLGESHWVFLVSVIPAISLPDFLAIDENTGLTLPDVYLSGLDGK